MPARVGRKNKEASPLPVGGSEWGLRRLSPLEVSLLCLFTLFFVDLSVLFSSFSRFLHLYHRHRVNSNDKLVSSRGKVILYDVTKAMSSWATSIYARHLFVHVLFIPTFTPLRDLFFSSLVASNIARDDLVMNKYRYYALMLMTQHLLSMANIIRR